MGLQKERTGLLLEQTKAMLHDQDLPMFLWAEACNTIVYIQNMSPHRALGNKTPRGGFYREEA
jgi:hypothetical protein